MIPDVRSEVGILQFQQLKADQRARLGDTVDACQLRQNGAAIEEAMGDDDIEMLFREIHLMKETAQECNAICAFVCQLSGWIDSNTRPGGVGVLDATN